MDKEEIKNIVIIGAGYIGIEMIEAAKNKEKCKINSTRRTHTNRFL